MYSTIFILSFYIYYHLSYIVILQDGWRAWKNALKQSNKLDDDGYEDEAARLAAQMVADAHKNFASKAASKGKGKGKKSNGVEAEAEPFSLLHKVWTVTTKYRKDSE